MTQPRTSRTRRSMPMALRRVVQLLFVAFMVVAQMLTFKLFVGPAPAQKMRGQQVAMEAKAEITKDVKKADGLSLPWQDKLNIMTGSFSFSERAENKEQIISLWAPPKISR